MWHKWTFALIIAAFSCTFADAQVVALKNNLLMDGMASPNLGIELRAGARTTIDIPTSLNFWNFSDKKKFKHFAIQPEFRWWICAPFTGHFFGIHAHYSYYNVGGLEPFKAIKNNRYEGWLAGAGISYGYNWILSSHWSLEATIGAGYAYMDYDKYPCGKCQPSSKHDTKHYFGPTRAAISLIYIIK